MRRRRFSTEFKVEAANLVLGQQYSIREACEAVGVGETAMRRWVGPTEKRATRHHADR